MITLQPIPIHIFFAGVLLKEQRSCRLTKALEVVVNQWWFYPVGKGASAEFESKVENVPSEDEVSDEILSEEEDVVVSRKGSIFSFFAP